MFYDLVRFTDGFEAVREINVNGQVTRYCDLSGINIGRLYEAPHEIISMVSPSWALLDPIPDPPSQPIPPTRILSKLAYLRLFTQDERIAIRTASDLNPALFDYLEMLKLADEIDLNDTDTVGAVMMLEAAGLIAEGRAAEVLNA